MIVLDASVLIAYLDAGDVHHRTAEALLEREIDEGFSVSSLTLAEVLVGPVRAGRLDAAVMALDDLDVVEQPFPGGTAAKLAELRVLTGLRMPDCCVLLAAQEAGARVASFDVALVRAAEALGLGTSTS